LSLGVTNVATASDVSANDLFRRTACDYNRDGYLAINDLHRTILSAKPPTRELYIWVDDEATTSLDNCRSVKLSDLGWSFKALGQGDIITAGTITSDWLRAVARSPKNPYILVASVDPSRAVKLLHAFASVGTLMRSDPVYIKEGKLNL